MNKYKLVLFVFLFLFSFLSIKAGDFTAFQGKTIGKINIKTERIEPTIVLEKFGLKEGQIFNEQKYIKAQENLHNMRIFKKLDFSIEETSNNTLTINITGNDGYYIFPLAFATGGSKRGAGITLVEGNLFKKGEMLFLFGGIGEDGAMTSVGGAYDDFFVNLKFEKLNFNRRFYDNNWVSNYGIFSTSKDKNDFNNPIFEDFNKYDKLSLLISKKIGNFTFFVMPEYNYVYVSPSIDNGKHSTLTFGVHYKENMRQGANFGALMGYGLSDKQTALKDLNNVKFGYALSTAYTKGASWTSSEYNINKLILSAQGSIELKNRDMFLTYVNARDSFDSPYEDKTRTTELIGQYGKYSRQRFGKRGIGFGATFIFYLLRNDLGLLGLNPFYEFASVFDNGTHYNQSGIGASLTYQFWRFPFPIGLNYTYNLNDDSKQVSFMVGVKF